MLAHRHNLSRLILFLGAGAPFLLFSPQTAGAQTAGADKLQLCKDTLADPDARIQACTWLLEHPSEGINRAEIYNCRGTAKVRKFDRGDNILYLEDAIADFTSALNENPRSVDALENRGLARKKQGNYNSAIGDFSQAIRLNRRSPDLYNLRGSAQLDKYEYNLAIADFGNAIALDRNYEKAYVNRGLALDSTGQPDLAIADLNTAVRLAPNDPLAHINRAMARMDKADFKGAVDDYSAAIGFDPNNSGIYTRRGEAWRLNGDLERSLADHNQAIALNPNDELAYNNRALTFNDQGKFKEAIADCDQAILLNPNSDLAYATRGLIRRKKGDLWGSLTDLNKAVQLNPSSPRALIFRGDTLRESGNNAGALADFNKVILIVPDCVAAYTGRGLTYEKKGDSTNAKADFEKALTLPANVDAGFARPAQALARERLVAIAVGRAVAKMDVADFNGAISFYAEVLRIDPKNSGVYTMRGEAWRLQGNLERSLEDHNKAISLNPNNAEAYNNRALAFNDQGNRDKAVADCGEAIKLNPASDKAYATRGLVRLLKRDLPGSLADLNKAVEFNSRSPTALTFRGDTLRESGDNDRAIKDFNEAIRNVPDFVAAYTGRGLTYEKIGDLAKAKADFEKALTLSANLDAGLAKPAQGVARTRLAALLAAEEAKRAKEAADRTAQEARAKEAAERATKEAIGRLAKVESAKLVPDDIQQLLYHRGHALLIGVADYKSGWPGLPNVKDDLRDLKKALTLHFETVDELLNPTVEQLRNQIREFLLGQWNTSDARLFIYYAGHGFPGFNRTSHHNEGYITGSDTPLQTTGRAAFNAVAFTDIIGWNKESFAQHVLTVFDSCFSGSLFQTKADTEPDQKNFEAIRTLIHKPVRYFITAGRQNQEVSAESTFAKLLVKGLTGAADKYNVQVVGADDLGNYLYHTVPNESQRPQTPQHNNIGNPYELAEGQFFFLTAPAAAGASAPLAGPPTDITGTTSGPLISKK